MGVVRKIRARAARSTAVPLSAERFPHLAAFLSGYLHQDFVLDHKTPAGALAAFLADAGAEERAGLRAEWQHFKRAIEGRLWREVRDAFTALGGAWRPGSRTALLDLFAALEALKD